MALANLNFSQRQVDPARRLAVPLKQPPHSIKAMNFFLPRRALIQDDPAKNKPTPTRPSVEAGDVDHEEKAPKECEIDVQGPDTFEILDTTPMKDSTPISKSSEKNSRHTSLDRRESPGIFKQLFLKTPPKPREQMKIEEEDSSRIVSNTSPSPESNTKDCTDQNSNEAQPPISEANETKVILQQQCAPNTRTLEAWENWDEDFYSMMSSVSSSLAVVSSSISSMAMASSSTVLSLTTHVFSRLTDDLKEKGTPQPTHVEKNLSIDSTQMSEMPSKSYDSDFSMNDQSYGDSLVEANVPATNNNKLQSQSIEELYNNVFTLNFIKELTNVGVILVNYDTSDSNMKSYLVLMRIEPGSKEETQLLEPKLTWVRLQDGKELIYTKQSITMLDIHSITAPEPVKHSKADNSGLHFIITTETGIVHLFECVTISDRDRALHGLRNVIAWLSYNVLLGSLVTSSPKSGDSALTLGSQIKSMNRLIAPFLE